MTFVSILPGIFLFIQLIKTSGKFLKDKFVVFSSFADLFDSVRVTPKPFLVKNYKLKIFTKSLTIAQPYPT